MLTVPLDLLHISPLRPSTPLPWPTAPAVALARALGFVEPVTARPMPGTTPTQYEILTGLQHWLLAQRAQLATIPVYLKEHLSDADARRLVEGETHSARPDPLAEARAIQAEVDRGRSVTAAGRERGLSRTEASHRLRLLRLAPDVQARIAHGELEPGKARALVGLPAALQLELAQRITREGLNTRQVEVLAQTYKQASRKSGGGVCVTPFIESPSTHDPDLVRLETELSERFGTSVKIDHDRDGSGHLVVTFANIEILEGILERLGIQSRSEA